MSIIVFERILPALIWINIIIFTATSRVAMNCFIIFQIQCQWSTRTLPRNLCRWVRPKMQQNSIFDKFRVNNELQTRLMTRKVRLISRWCGNIGRGCLFVHSLPRNAFHWAVINLGFNVALCAPPDHLRRPQSCHSSRKKESAVACFPKRVQEMVSIWTWCWFRQTTFFIPFFSLFFDTYIYKLAVNFHMNAFAGNAVNRNDEWWQKWRVSSPRKKNCKQNNFHSGDKWWNVAVQN